MTMASYVRSMLRLQPVLPGHALSMPCVVIPSHDVMMSGDMYHG